MAMQSIDIVTIYDLLPLNISKHYFCPAMIQMKY